MFFCRNLSFQFDPCLSVGFIAIDCTIWKEGRVRELEEGCWKEGPRAKLTAQRGKVCSKDPRINFSTVIRAEFQRQTPYKAAKAGPSDKGQETLRFAIRRNPQHSLY